MSFFATWEHDRFAHQLSMTSPEGPIEYGGEGPLDVPRFAMNGFNRAHSLAEFFAISLYVPPDVEARLVAFTGVARPGPEPAIALDGAPQELDREALAAMLRQLARADAQAPSNGAFTDRVTLERAELVAGSWHIGALHTVHFEGTNPAFDGPWEQAWRWTAHVDGALRTLHSFERAAL